jgi:hypothetical protein
MNSLPPNFCSRIRALQTLHMASPSPPEMPEPSNVRFDKNCFANLIDIRLSIYLVRVARIFIQDPSEIAELDYASAKVLHCEP